MPNIERKVVRNAYWVREIKTGKDILLTPEMQETGNYTNALRYVKLVNKPVPPPPAPSPVKKAAKKKAPAKKKAAAKKAKK